MKIVSTSFLALAAALSLATATASSDSLRRELQQWKECGTVSLEYEYDIGNGSNLTSQKTDGNFNVQGSVRCNLECESGDAELYVRFGAAGGPASEDNNDAMDENEGCNKELLVNNEDQVRPGFRYTVVATDYVDMKITCTCYEDEDPPTLQQVRAWEASQGQSGTPSTSSGSASCFAGSTMVQTLHHGPMALEDVSVGELIWVENDKYEPIYAFGHWNPTQEADFVQVHFQAKDNKEQQQQKPLELTPEHLIYLKDQPHPVRASQLEVGDVLEGTAGAVITSLAKISQSGLYMPLTPSGKLMVHDGILASSYVSISEQAPTVASHPWLPRLGVPSEHALLHAWLAPLRLVCQGVSSHFCQTTSSSAGGNGIHPWLRVGESLVEFANHQSNVVQILLGLPIVSVLVLLQGLESVLTARPLAFVIALLVVWLGRRRRQDALKKGVKGE